MLQNVEIRAGELLENEASLSYLLYLVFGV